MLLAAACMQAHATPESEQIRARVELLQREVPATAAGSAIGLNAAVAGFYGPRGYEPAWSDPARRHELAVALAGLVLDGLDPDDYAVSAVEHPAAGDDPAGRAAADVLATRSYLLALAHLFRGKVDPRTLYPVWNVQPRQADPVAGLGIAAQAAYSGRIADAFDRARPQHPVYGALRTALAGLREVADRGGWPQIADGPTLRPGDRDTRVAVLRQRLAIGGYLPKDTPETGSYDDILQAAVRQFQAEQYLDADGNVGRATRAALNVTVQARIDQLRVNLERARWLLQEISGDFVLVDIAGFRVRYFTGAHAVWTSRIQVGRSLRPTPMFKSQISQITFNPTWTVPPTIFTKDVLPKVRGDLHYLAKNHIRAFDPGGRELAPELIDWTDPHGIKLRQDAGKDNSLGRVAFRFPNPFSVYLHETPHKELFAYGQRAFSSGCIRVEDPFELARLLLADPERWNRAAVDRVVAEGKTIDVPLPRPVTILLAYWTVDLHADGRASFKPDMYGYDPQILRALEDKTQR